MNFFKNMSKLLFYYMTFLLTSCLAQGGGVVDKQIVDSLNLVQPQPLAILAAPTHSFVIKVKNQEQFDTLNEAIHNAILKGERNIKVVISKGCYRFKENHLHLNDIEYDGTITIEGKDVIVTSCDNTRQLLSSQPWTSMEKAEELIKVVDVEKKLCFLPYHNNIDSLFRTNYTKIQITKSYKAPVYSVVDINNEGVYFIADDLKYNTNHRRKEYSFNSDYIINGSLPRFRLFDKTKYIDYHATCFLNVRNCNLEALTIKGISFIGNKEGYALFRTKDFKSRQFIIQQCCFEGIRSSVAVFDHTDNVVFDNNNVKNTDGDEIRFIKNSQNIRVTNNLFCNCGKAMNQSFCVICREASYYIANNVFRDFNYSAIGVGVWHGTPKEYPSQGIIEKNEIYYTQEYFNHKERNTLMDSGAIYAWTQNDNVIIRFNYIHDYEGCGNNRGIFCDDGANNLKMYCNLILNTPNSYSIDSRFCIDQHDGISNNTNNLIAYNIVENGILFKGYFMEDRICLKGTNYLLHKKEVEYLESDYSCLSTNDEDIIIYCDDISSKGIVADDEAWGRIIESPYFNHINKNMKRLYIKR